MILYLVHNDSFLVCVHGLSIETQMLMIASNAPRTMSPPLTIKFFCMEANNSNSSTSPTLWYTLLSLRHRYFSLYCKYLPALKY